MLARPSSYGYTGEEHGARQINNNGVKMRKYLEMKNVPQQEKNINIAVELYKKLK